MEGDNLFELFLFKLDDHIKVVDDKEQFLCFKLISIIVFFEHELSEIGPSIDGIARHNSQEHTNQQKHSLLSTNVTNHRILRY